MSVYWTSSIFDDRDIDMFCACNIVINGRTYISSEGTYTNLPDYNIYGDWIWKTPTLTMVIRGDVDWEFVECGPWTVESWFADDSDLSVFIVDSNNGC